MTVKRKATKPLKASQMDIDDIINKGGRTTTEAKAPQPDEELRFTLRIPQKLINEIDKERKLRVGNVSRNQWILEAVAEHLN